MHSFVPVNPLNTGLLVRSGGADSNAIVVAGNVYNWMRQAGGLSHTSLKNSFHNNFEGFPFSFDFSTLQRQKRRPNFSHKFVLIDHKL